MAASKAEDLLTDRTLAGRIALVTGAGRGIGAAVAKRLAGAGAHVILLARTVGALEEVDDAIRGAGGSATLMPQDLGKLGELDKLGPVLARRFGRLDILVGNAAMLGTLTPVTHMETMEWQRVISLNLAANLRLLRSAENLLRASDAGRVIFTTSGLARKPLAYWGAYCASKAALEMTALTYAAEVAETAMRVNLVDPGIVDTAMLREAFPGGYQGRTQSVDQVAEAFLGLALPSCTRHGEVVKVA